MSVKTRKPGNLISVVVLALAVVYLLIRPFIVATPEPQKVEPEPVVVEKPVEEKPVWVETYVPKHNVQLPDFAGIRDVKEKKRRFFGFMGKYVERENEKLLAQRIWLLELKHKIAENQTLSDEDSQKLNEFYQSYRIKHEAMSVSAAIDALLDCVDGLPKELVLMQAANESAWGSSRFARLGLNFFGQWCYSKDCGIVPRYRPKGKTYEVEAFMSVQQSVTSYFKNINTNPAYKLLREIRAQLRANHLPLNAQVLATGLLPYSERGDLYVQEITKMIEHNQQFMTE